MRKQDAICTAGLDKQYIQTHWEELQTGCLGNLKKVLNKLKGMFKNFGLWLGNNGKRKKESTIVLGKNIK